MTRSCLRVRIDQERRVCSMACEAPGVDARHSSRVDVLSAPRERGSQVVEVVELLLGPVMGVSGNADDERLEQHDRGGVAGEQAGGAAAAVEHDLDAADEFAG